MSRKQRIIIAALAITNVLVLCGLIATVAQTIATRQSRPSPTLAPTARPPTATQVPTRTPTATAEPQPTATPRPTRTPAPSPTPWPTFTPSVTPPATETPTLTPPPLQNPTFDNLSWNQIPGWRTGAFVNWTPGQPFDAQTSFAEPRFHPADDPRQRINGSTLQIDTEPWVKLRAWVYQPITVTPGSRVQFQVNGMGFVRETNGGYFLKAGIDPDGGEGCENAQWGEERIANQNDGVVELTSPEVTAGEVGRVTLCMFAETQFAQVYHAAFFDDAAVEITPPE